MKLQRKIKPYEKLLPICCVCKKIRDDTNKKPGKGKWMSVEVYMSEKANIDVTHTFCPECLKKTYERDIAALKSTTTGIAGRLLSFERIPVFGFLSKERTVVRPEIQ